MSDGESAILEQIRDQLDTILKILGTSIFGVSLREDPVAFVQAAASDLVLKWALGTVRAIIGDVGVLWSQFIGAGLDFGAIFVELGSDGGAFVLALLADVNSTVVGIAQAAGPLSPIVVVIGWAFVVGIVVAIASVVLEVVKWVT